VPVPRALRSSLRHPCKKETSQEQVRLVHVEDEGL